MFTQPSYKLLLLFCLTCFSLPAIGEEIPTESAMIATLTSEDSPPADKAITCKQLAVFGSAECVPSVAALLSDPELNSWARITLEAINDEAAETALVDAMSTTEGLQLVGVINSLGVKRSNASVAMLAEKLTSEDDTIAKAAAMSLGKIAGTDAITALKKSLAETRMDVRSAAAEGLIRCAEGLDPAEAIAIYDQVLETELPIPRKVEATRGAILTRGKDGVELLIKSLASDNKRLRYIALTTARELKGEGVSDALLAARSDVPASQAAYYLIALGDRGEASMLQAMLATIEQPAQSDAEIDIKTAAIGVVARIGDPSSLDALIAAATADNDVVATAGRAALEVVGDEDMNDAIIQRASQAEGKTLETWIAVIGARRIDAVDLLVKAAKSDQSSTAHAAITALGDVATIDELSILINAAFSGSNANTKSVGLKSLQAACVRMTDKAACVNQLETAIASADAASQIAILEILAAMGGTEALVAIEKAALSSNPNWQNASTRLLGGWMTVDAAETLKTIAEQPKHPYRIRAVRGYLRILRQFVMPQPQRNEMAQTAMTFSDRDDEKRLILDAAGRYPSLEMLKIASELSKSESLKNESQAVAMAIAQKVKATPQVDQLLADMDIQSMKIEIVKAMYGAGDEAVDVTARLQKQVGSLPIIRLANPNYNSNFGGDPAPSKPKQLSIEYKIDGRAGKATFNENDSIVLPIPK